MGSLSVRTIIPTARYALYFLFLFLASKKKLVSITKTERSPWKENIDYLHMYIQTAGPNFVICCTDVYRLSLYISLGGSGSMGEKELPPKCGKVCTTPFVALVFFFKKNTELRTLLCLPNSGIQALRVLPLRCASQADAFQSSPFREASGIASLKPDHIVAEMRATWVALWLCGCAASRGRSSTDVSSTASTNNLTSNTCPCYIR